MKNQYLYVLIHRIENQLIEVERAQGPQSVNHTVHLPS